jgi:hypothetical protein
MKNIKSQVYIKPHNHVIQQASHLTRSQVWMQVVFKTNDQIDRQLGRQISSKVAGQTYQQIRS